MAGPGIRRRRAGVRIAIAIAVAAALGLFASRSAGPGKTHASWSVASMRPDGTIVIRVLGPILY